VHDHSSLLVPANANSMAKTVSFFIGVKIVWLKVKLFYSLAQQGLAH
jgi:hypothetical protein